MANHTHTHTHTHISARVLINALTILSFGKLHSAVATSERSKHGGREGAGGEQSNRKLSSLVRHATRSLARSLARHISHKLASLGFIYEPMILPAICLNGNVTTLASQMKTRDSLPIGKQQKLWLQL